MSSQLPRSNATSPNTRSHGGVSSVASGTTTTGRRRRARTCIYAVALLTSLLFVALVAWSTSSDDRGTALLREDALGHYILMEKVMPHIAATHTAGRNRDDVTFNAANGGAISASIATDIGIARPRHPWRAYFIAMNLFNNAPLIPKLAENLATFISEELRRKGLVDVAARVFISIFSNGSEDSTAEDITNILVPALEAAGVPRDRRMHVVPSGTTCGGFHKKPKHMDRILWMACIRNEAMRPFYNEGLGLFAPNRQPPSATTTKATPSPPEGEVDSFHPPNASSMPPNFLEMPLPDGSTLTSDNTVVLFLNDIVFLPTDLTKLLESNYARSQRLLEYNRRWRSQRSSRSSSNPSTEAPLVDEEEPLLTTERGFSSLWDGFNMACGMDFYASFYDQWVTRDYDGRAFDSWPPYAQDFGTQQIFYEAESLRADRSRPRHVHDERPRHTAAPVRCCWNGAAAIRGSMFLRHDIRFRKPVSDMFNMSRGSDSCYSSECMLICKDIIKAAVCEHSRQEKEDPSSARRHQARPALAEACGDDDVATAPHHQKGSTTPLASRSSVAAAAAARRIHNEEDTWVDIGGIFINPHVKVAYDEENFALHHEQWFVSSAWFYRLISFLRMGTWLLPDRFEPPGGDAHPTWMECVLPQDTLPLLTILWTSVVSVHVAWLIVLTFVVVATVLLVAVRRNPKLLQSDGGGGGLLGASVRCAACFVSRIGRAIPCHPLRLLFRRATVAVARRTNNGVAASRLDNDSDEFVVVHGEGAKSVAVTFLTNGNNNVGHAGSRTSSPIVSPNTASSPLSHFGGPGAMQHAGVALTRRTNGLTPSSSSVL